MENGSVFTLNNKKILVTGASSGIGKVIAQELSKQGAILVLSGRNKARLEKTLNLLSGHGHKISICDITSPEDLDKLSSESEVFDGIIFCAGIINYMPAKYLDTQTFDDIINVNFKSQILLYQQLHKKKKIKKGASLVFISSVSALCGVAGTLAYSASKAAINSSVRVLATELSKLKIRVNSISPGLIDTPLLEVQELDQNSLNKELSKYPLGKGNAIDIANASIFLLSDASRWITGIDLIVDRGYLLKI